MSTSANPKYADLIFTIFHGLSNKPEEFKRHDLNLIISEKKLSSRLN